MEKINIAELLKDCPKGMELDCSMYDNVVLDTISDGSIYPIKIKTPEHFIFLTKNGCYSDNKFSKCVIFPKGKTTWEGFVPPCKFKDGDILFVDCSDDEEDKSYQYIFILNKPKFLGKWHSYCMLDGVGNYQSHETYLTDEEYHPRFATEEEKQKLFDAIKDNGYKWNPETKTLEKLPKFKVGDKIKHKDSGIYCTLGEYSEGISAYRTNIGLSLTYKDMEQWELAPNKFDIDTLVPFESRVLVRNGDRDIWKPAIFGCYIYKSSPYYVLGGTCWKYCIPYEGNKHLLRTTNDCDEYYKIW